MLWSDGKIAWALEFFSGYARPDSPVATVGNPGCAFCRLGKLRAFAVLAQAPGGGMHPNLVFVRIWRYSPKAAFGHGTHATTMICQNCEEK